METLPSDLPRLTRAWFQASNFQEAADQLRVVARGPVGTVSAPALMEAIGLPRTATSHGDVLKALEAAAARHPDVEVRRAMAAGIAVALDAMYP